MSEPIGINATSVEDIRRDPAAASFEEMEFLLERQATMDGTRIGAWT